MTQYAVTLVAYIHANDEDHAKMVVSEMIDESLLYKSRNESIDIVEVSEVEFTEET